MTEKQSTEASGFSRLKLDSNGQMRSCWETAGWTFWEESSFET